MDSGGLIDSESPNSPQDVSCKLPLAKKTSHLRQLHLLSWMTFSRLVNLLCRRLYFQHIGSA